MKQREDRYFLFVDTDGSLSICDRHIVEAERDHRIVTGLGKEQAAELLKKLNAQPDDTAK